jgi:hypothetical protein
MGLGQVILRRGAALAGTPPAPLVRHDPAALENLPAPHASGFASINGTGQTRRLNWAAATERLRLLEVCRYVGEPEIGIPNLTRQTEWCPLADWRWRYVGTGSTTWSPIAGLAC